MLLSYNFSVALFSDCCDEYIQFYFFFFFYKSHLLITFVYFFLLSISGFYLFCVICIINFSFLVTLSLGFLSFLFVSTLFATFASLLRNFLYVRHTTNECGFLHGRNGNKKFLHKISCQRFF